MQERCSIKFIAPLPLLYCCGHSECECCVENTTGGLCSLTLLAQSLCTKLTFLLTAAMHRYIFYIQEIIQKRSQTVQEDVLYDCVISQDFAGDVTKGEQTSCVLAPQTWLHILLLIKNSFNLLMVAWHMRCKYAFPIKQCSLLL